jgi:signal transduction histidine kinase/PAS domain-containing protein
MSSEPSAAPASQYLRLIFRQVPGAVWATDRSLRFTYLLGGTLKLDVRNPEELVGTTLYEFVRTTDPVEPVIAHHLAALAGTAQSFQYVRGGHSLEVLVEPLRDDEGAVIGCVGAAIDASEHRDVQERLARTEARLAEAQRVAHVGSFEWEVADDRVVWSDELQRIHGLAGAPRGTFDELVSRIHPDDRDRVRAALFDAVRQAQPFEFDHRIVRPNGEIRVLHNAGAVVRDESGAAVRVVGSCWDVTVSHETTERLRRSLSLLEATLDATADGILVVDLQGRVVAHNRRFLELWRLPPALAERGDDRAMVSSVSDQLEDPHAFETRVRDLYSRPEQEGFDALRFKDGRAFERHSTPQFVGPDIVGRVWTFRDVTERERMLRQATFLADATRLLASLDIDNALRAVGRLAVPFLGERYAVDLVRNGSLARIVVVPEEWDPDLVPELHTGVLAGHPVVYTARERSHIAVPLVCRDEVRGALSFVAARHRRYTEQDLALVEELGRRAALAVDNARLYDGAREALRSRDEFLSIAAHEIRGPVTSIHLAAQSLLRKSLSPAGIQTALQVIEREDRRLGRFVDDLLDLGRIQTNQLYFNIEEVDLGSVIRGVVSQLSDDAARAGSPVTVTTEGGLKGYWDRTRLQQVVSNLLANAIKFGAGKPIEVAAVREAERIRVSVVDHGIGIDPAVLPKIFDPFERGVGVRHYGGLGLGLHIAKTIVEGLGGTLTGHSRPDEGSAFTIELPAAARVHDGEPIHSGGR